MKRHFCDACGAESLGNTEGEKRRGLTDFTAPAVVLKEIFPEADLPDGQKYKHNERDIDEDEDFDVRYIEFDLCHDCHTRVMTNACTRLKELKDEHHSKAV